MKKIISIILAISVLMSFSVFLSGCGDKGTSSKQITSSSNKETSSEDSVSSTVSETESQENSSSNAENLSSNISTIDSNSSIKNEIDSSSGTKYDNVPKINLFKDGEANFKVVRSETANTDVISTAKYICRAISDTHGATVEHKNDSVANDNTMLEISLGVTNRPRAAKLTEELKKANGNYGMDYSIVFDNNIIYIVGGSDVALLNGAKAFLAYFCSTTKGSIPNNFDYRYHLKDSAVFTINKKIDLSAYKLVVPQYNLSYLIGREVNTLSNEILLNNGSFVLRTNDNTVETEYEIVIGNTKRANTPIPDSTDDYMIKTQGNKIFIVGGSDGATALAVKQFISWVKDRKKLPAVIDYTGSYDSDIQNATEEDYKLVWYDEFDATSLDKSIWSPAKGLYSTPTNGNIAPRKKMFTESAENVKLENGKLVMRGSYDDDYYYGAELRTFNSMWFKYGIIEISCKMNFSKGICPAFWLLGNQNNKIAGEFDLFEGLGEYAKNLNAIKCTTITHPTAETGYQSGTMYNGAINHYSESFYSLGKDTTWDDDYHTIGCEWTPTSLKYVIDGDVFLDIPTDVSELSYYTHNGLMQVILTMYSGNDVCTPFTGVPDSTTDWEGNNFTIDHIRLYQDGKGILQN